MKRDTEAVKLKNGAAVFFILLPFAVVFASLFAGRYDLTLTEVTGALAHFVRDVSEGSFCTVCGRSGGFRYFRGVLLRRDTAPSAPSDRSRLCRSSSLGERNGLSGNFPTLSSVRAVASARARDSVRRWRFFCSEAAPRPMCWPLPSGSAPYC